MGIERTRLRRYYVENRPYFITTRVADGQPVFADAQNAGILVSVLYNFRRERRYLLLAFVIMPDHLHVVLVPRQWDISRIMHGIKRGSARIINRGEGQIGSLWQPRFFDRAIRDEAELSSAVEYIHDNPVKAGLTERAEDYPFSSGNAMYETDLAEYLGLGAQVVPTCATGTGLERLGKGGRDGGRSS